MFREFGRSAGAFQRANQNKNAGGQSDEINYENKSAEVQPESQQTVDDQIKREQNHSEFLHARHSFCHSERSRGISYCCLAVTSSEISRDVSTPLDMTLERFQIFDQIPFFVLGQFRSVIVAGI